MPPYVVKSKTLWLIFSKGCTKDQYGTATSVLLSPNQSLAERIATLTSESISRIDIVKTFVVEGARSLLSINIVDHVSRGV